MLDEEVTTEEVIELVNNDEFESRRRLDHLDRKAPTEVKEEFEEQVNVSGDFDNYVRLNDPEEDRVFEDVSPWRRRLQSLFRTASSGGGGGVTGPTEEQEVIKDFFSHNLTMSGIGL